MKQISRKCPFLDFGSMPSYSLPCYPWLGRVLGLLDGYFGVNQGEIDLQLLLKVCFFCNRACQSDLTGDMCDVTKSRLTGARWLTGKFLTRFVSKFTSFSLCFLLVYGQMDVNSKWELTLRPSQGLCTKLGRHFGEKNLLACPPRLSRYETIRGKFHPREGVLRKKQRRESEARQAR